METAAILDIDGTLIDTNYQHALAWFRAFKRFDIVLPVWRIHRRIGMGGDHIIEVLCGEEKEHEFGDQIREAETDLYQALIGEVQPVQGARDFIIDLKKRGHPVVLASSAKDAEVEHYLGLSTAATSSTHGRRRRTFRAPSPIRTSCWRRWKGWRFPGRSWSATRPLTAKRRNVRGSRR